MVIKLFLWYFHKIVKTFECSIPFQFRSGMTILFAVKRDTELSFLTVIIWAVFLISDLWLWCLLKQQQQMILKGLCWKAGLLSTQRFPLYFIIIEFSRICGWPGIPGCFVYLFCLAQVLALGMWTCLNSAVSLWPWYGRNPMQTMQMTKCLICIGLAALQ